MRLIVRMRLENCQEGNTWYSNALDGDAEIQVHMPREVYLALGKLEFIEVTIEPDRERS